jgi:hypothetical protein
MAFPFYPPPEGSRGHGPLLLFPFYPPSEGSKTYGPLPFAKPSGPGVDPSKIQGPICKEDCRVLGLRVDSCINQGPFCKKPWRMDTAEPTDQERTVGIFSAIVDALPTPACSAL